MRFMLFPYLLGWICIGVSSAQARHPVIQVVTDYLVGKAIDKHNEAAERLGYSPFLPPPPGHDLSEWHQRQIEHIDRERHYQERMERYESGERTSGSSPQRVDEIDDPF